MNPFTEMVVDPATIGIMRYNGAATAHKYEIVISIGIQHKFISTVGSTRLIAALAQQHRKFMRNRIRLDPRLKGELPGLLHGN